MDIKNFFETKWLYKKHTINLKKYRSLFRNLVWYSLANGILLPNYINNKIGLVKQFDISNPNSLNELNDMMIHNMEGIQKFIMDNVYNTFINYIETRKSKSKIVPIVNWVKFIVGVDELELRRNINKYIRYNDGSDDTVGDNIPIDHMFIVSTNGRYHLAGKFDTPTFGELRQNIYNKPNIRNDYPPILIVIKENNLDTQCVDIMYNQMYPLNSFLNNRNVLFQVASQFNALESTSSDISIINHDNFLRGYAYDNTQGPLASISTASGSIVRAYKPFRDSSGISQINLLDNSAFNDYLTVNNGYVYLKPNIANFPHPKTTDYNELLDKAKVASHINVQPEYYKKSGPYDSYDYIYDQNQIIDQIYCSGINFNQGGNDKGRENKSLTFNKNQTQIIKFALDLAYKGTYLQAYQNNNRKIVLTLVGAGAFCPKDHYDTYMKMLYDTIIETHIEYSKKMDLECVEIIWYTNEHDNIKDYFVNNLKREGIPWGYINKGTQDDVLRESVLII